MNVCEGIVRHEIDMARISHQQWVTGGGCDQHQVYHIGVAYEFKPNKTMLTLLILSCNNPVFILMA